MKYTYIIYEKRVHRDTYVIEELESVKLGVALDYIEEVLKTKKDEYIAGWVSKITDHKYSDLEKKVMLATDHIICSEKEGCYV